MPGRIIVGVDGSDPSKDALRWALEEARLRGARLVALHAWVYPGYANAGLAPVTADLAEALAANAAALLAAAVTEVEAGAEDVRVDQVVVQGSPANALVSAAAGADLLVVGSRGRGGFTGLLLGSVSQQCAHHAPCPVVVVPPRR